MSQNRESSAPPDDGRTSTHAPAAGIVTPHAGRVAGEPVPKRRRRTVEPSEVTDWHSSSHALLNGLEVKDYTSRIPSEIFDRLFKD